MHTSEVILDMKCADDCVGHATTDIMLAWRLWLRQGGIIGFHNIIRTAPNTWRIRSTWKVV